jgi:hypothetical protein
MSLEQIKAAIASGKHVHWMHEGYEVTRDKAGQYHITFTATCDCIGLTWSDGVTLNGKPWDFFTR